MGRGPIVYTLPPGTTPQIAGTTIEPAIFNAFADDVANTFNTPQPVEYGGTGATNASDARTALGLQVDVNVSSVPRGHIYGLTTSNNATDAVNDIDIAAGQAASDATSPVMMTLAASLTKRLDAVWAVGTGNGGLDTGAIADATYHAFLISRSDTGVVDVLFSLSPTSPTMPSSYDRKRRIGSIIRASGTIVGFIQDGDRFYLKTPISAFVVPSPGTAAITLGLRAPTGIRVSAILSVVVSAVANADIAVLVTDLAAPDVAPSAAGPFTAAAIWNTSGDIVSASSMTEVMTNTGAQIRARLNFSNASASLRGTTFGWIDTRGRTA